MKRIKSFLVALCVIVLLLIAGYCLLNDLSGMIPAVVYTTGI